MERGIKLFLVIARRFYQYDPREISSILGVPSRPSHLPEAEPILPGHTLLRPAIGMLKSSVKFPHKDLEDGSGVYGNIDNLGIRHDARNERLLYTGFRRFPSDYIMNKAKLHSHVLRTSATSEEGSVEKQKESIPNEQPMNGESTGKMKFLLDSKDIYNNIKVHKNAPEFNELMPKEYQEDNIREWWYYNADDYTPFDY
ncbi:unnamed protein product, partial [Brenthis ino]